MGKTLYKKSNPGRVATVERARQKRHDACGISCMQQNLFTEEKVELCVRHWLANSGYQLIRLNWQYCQANVDIIAARYNRLHFIGVTTKKYPDNGLSCQGMTRRKVLALLQASQQYMKRNPQWKEAVIDVLTVTLIREEPADCTLTRNIQMTY
jgi:Holliday junction resolvase-like predicted endonuclease